MISYFDDVVEYFAVVDNQLAVVDNQLAVVDNRLDDLELDISFSVWISAHLTISDTPAIFDIVKHNNGLGYDVSTGQFCTSRS